MDKSVKEDIKYGIIFIGIIALIVAAIAGMIHYGNQYTEYEYKLCEMNDGVYAIYYTTHSRAPAYNYEVVTVCCNGNVYTFQGDVCISFTNDEPYVKVRDCNVVNADDIYVYVPQGTVVYQQSVNIGK